MKNIMGKAYAGTARAVSGMKTANANLKQDGKVVNESEQKVKVSGGAVGNQIVNHSGFGYTFQNKT